MPPIVETYFKKIEDIPNRGLGGCLLFCYTFILFLRKKRMAIKSFQIIQYDYSDGECTDHNIGFLNGEKETADSSYHFTFMYDGNEYDCMGLVTPERRTGWWATKRTILPTKSYAHIVLFCQTALKYGSWNSMFDSKQWTPIIEERFGIKF